MRIQIRPRLLIDLTIFIDADTWWHIVMSPSRVIRRKVRVRTSVFLSIIYIVNLESEGIC